MDYFPGLQKLLLHVLTTVYPGNRKVLWIYLCVGKLKNRNLIQIITEIVQFQHGKLEREGP